MNDTSLLQAALDYAARGFRVIPLHHPVLLGTIRCSCGNRSSAHSRFIGKHPRLSDWPKGATTDTGQIRQWWQTWPEANIGLVTGADSGLAILDVDPRNGGEASLDDLQRLYEPLPDTPIVLSGGGGQHYYFLTDRDLPCPKISPGLDFLGDGGHYALAPPSRHLSGNLYVFELSATLQETPLAPLPDWLLRLVEAMAQTYTSAAADLPDDLPVIDLEALRLSDRIKRLIVDGPGPDQGYPSRSEAVYAVLHSMIRSGYDDATIAAILLNPTWGISEKPLGQKNPRSPNYWRLTLGWVAREIARARAKARHPWGMDSQQARAPHTPPVPVDPRPEPDRARLPLSDYVNVMALVERSGSEMRYCSPWRNWLSWTGTHWQRDDTGAVMQAAKATIRAMLDTLKEITDDKTRDQVYRHIKASLNTSRLEAMVKSARDEPGIAILPDAFDQHNWLLNCANGTLDLHTGRLMPHRREDYLTRRLEISYDPEATCPTWERFLWHILGGSLGPEDPHASAALHEARYEADERARRLSGFLQRAVGYSLTGDTSEHCFFLLYGTGRNGKSTFIETVQAMLGPYGKTAEMSTFLARKDEGVRNDLADLHGARFVAASEAERGKRLSESLVKRLTAGDRIKARFLFQDYFEFLPQMHVWLAVNDKPVIRGADLAMWERIRLIPFEVFLAPEERDRHLGEKLKDELPGILAWAIKGCLEWQRYDGLKEPPEVTHATTTYRQEMDTLGQFLDECCFMGPEVRVKASTLYKAYQTWCEESGFRAESMMEIGSRIDTMNIEKKKSNGWWYRGIGLHASD